MPSAYRVVIYDSKGEIWERLNHDSESEAREEATRWSANNRSFRIVIRKGEDDVAHYRKGKEYKPRPKAEDSHYTFMPALRDSSLVDVFRKLSGQRIGTLRRIVRDGSAQWSATDRTGKAYPGPFRNREEAAKAMDTEADRG